MRIRPLAIMRIAVSCVQMALYTFNISTVDYMAYTFLIISVPHLLEVAIETRNYLVQHYYERKKGPVTPRGGAHSV